jgi:hypothetical protein
MSSLLFYKAAPLTTTTTTTTTAANGAHPAPCIMEQVLFGSKAVGE